MSDPSLKQDLALSLKALVLMGLVAAAIYLSSWALERVQGDETPAESSDSVPAAEASEPASPNDNGAEPSEAIDAPEGATASAEPRPSTMSQSTMSPSAMQPAQGAPTNQTSVNQGSHVLGEGSGAPGGEAPSAMSPALRREQVEQAGSRFQEAVRQAVADAVPELGFCYRWQLENNPGLAGRIVMRFKVDAEGRVIEAVAAEGDLEDDVVRGCVSSVANRMRFPPTGSEVSITYPIRFSQEDPEEETAEAEGAESAEGDGSDG